MTEYTLERALEWEPAAEPIVLQHVSLPVPPFIAGTRKVTIQRDEEFRLNFVAEGFLANGNELLVRHEAMDRIAAGTSVDADEVSFGAPGGPCTLNAFFHESPSARFSAENPEHAPFRHEGSVDRFAHTLTHKLVAGDGREPTFEPVGAPAWRSDWFINGPHDPVLGRSTRRRRNVRFSRERDFGSVHALELPRGGDGRDHFVVDAGTLRFAVCEVPEKLAPEWAHAISIEYRSLPDRPIPDEETREAVGEIVSFVLGRRLIPIGSTLFDDTGWSIETLVVNPHQDGLRALCSAGDNPPLPLGILSSEVEEALGKLVPAYLRLRGAMELRNALWGYWSACEASTPIDLAIFRAATEALKKGWFASTGAKSNGNYMSKDDFDRATSDLFTALEGRIAEHPAAKQVMNNLRRQYRMSGNEEVRAFYAEINLPLGPTEQAAMGAANIPAHGGITTGGKLNELVRHGRAYRTLFARTLLRLLGYDGAYVDYTAPGFPSRPLDEPAAGFE